MTSPSQHSHNFVEEYDGLVGLGLDRKTNEYTLTYYLQKFSDDQLMSRIIKRLTSDELQQLLTALSRD